MRSRGSCTANLSPCEKQLLLSFSTNGKDSTQRLLACIMHTDALNTDPDSCPPDVKPRPMKTINTVLTIVGVITSSNDTVYDPLRHRPLLVLAMKMVQGTIETSPMASVLPAW